MEQKIKIEAEIDFASGQVKIKPIEDPWSDLGYLLEVTAFMSKIVMDHEEKTKPEILQYINKYLDRAISDYKSKV
jgi:hypothetical protein